MALLNTPFNLQLVNPVIPSWHVDEDAICQDIDAGMGWDQDWLVQCSKSFSMIKWCVACFGLVLMIAQWWALMTVRRWGKEIRFQRWVQDDVEKTGILHDNDVTRGEKCGHD